MSLAPREPAWQVGDSLDRVVDAVRSRSASVRPLADGSWMTNCLNPAHRDRHPSLHISHIRTEHGGRVLFKCFSDAAGCGSADDQDWAAWAGLDYDDLFDDQRWSLHNRPETPPRRTVRQRRTGATLGRLGPLPGKIADTVHELLGLPAPAPPAGQQLPDHEHTWVDVESYDYRDDADRVVHRVHRQRCTHDGCPSKNFPQSYLRHGGDPDRGGDWFSSKSKAGLGPDWHSRLYRWPHVSAALADGFAVWVFEGEKDVHTAEGCGLVATTNPGGAGGFDAGHAHAFRGSRSEVNVVLDRDRDGRARGVKVHALLTQVGVGGVRLWLPATLEVKSDFTDHIQAGHTVEDLVEVPVAALTAWHLLETKVAAALTLLDTATQETSAQLQVAEHERAHGRAAAGAERARYAARWAKEAVRAHTQLVDAGQQIADLAAAVAEGSPGQHWVLEAVESVATQLRTATARVRDLYARTDQLVPPQVETARIVLASAGGAAVAAVEDADPGQPGRPDLELIRGGGGGHTGSIHIEHDMFEVVDGELTQVRWRTVRDRQVKTHTRVVNADIRLVTKEFAESDEDIEADTVDLAELGDRDGRGGAKAVRNLPRTTHVVLQIPDEQTGPGQVRVPFDDYENGAFLAHLPLKHLNYSRSRAGRDKVITAINYVSEDTEMTTSYRATGWRRRGDGSYMYVMSGGAIDQDGYQPVPTNLTGAISLFDLPNPTSDPARIREAFLSAASPIVDRFPDRVGAVLVGQAFRAALCPNPWVTVISGSPGTGKTGLAAVAQHFFGEMWDRMRPAASMSGNGATANALRIYAHQAKDAVLFLDDNAPTAGVEAAWKRLEETSRMLHNQEARGRAERSGQGVLPDSRPRTSGLITTELPARVGSSGGRRDLLVPITRRDIDISDIVEVDDWPLRHRRALLMASFLQWAASDYRGHLRRLAALRDEFAREMKNRVEVDPRVRERHADKVAELWGGWGLLLAFLAEREAISDPERQQWAERIREALVVAAEAAEDPDLVESAGQRACELLRYALGNALAYAADSHTGGAPRGIERRLGWRPASGSRDVTAVALGDVDWRVDQRAISLGHVNLTPEGGDEAGPELLVERVALEAALKAAAAAMPDTSSMDLGTVLRALEDEGVLKVRVEQRRGGLVVRRTLDRTIPCLPSISDPDKPLREKRIVLRLAELFGEAGPDPRLWGPSSPESGPGPMEPRPHDVPDHANTTDFGEHHQPGEDGCGPGENEQQMGNGQEGGKAMQDTNAGGLTLTAGQVVATRPCARCGVRCGLEFAGVALHVPCFWATTATSVEQLHQQYTGRDHPNGHPAPAPTPMPAPTPAPPPAPATPATPPADPGSEIAAAKPSGKAMRPSVFTAAACVVDVDRVWLPDGTWRPLPAPITHLGQLEELGRSLRLGLEPVGWHSYPQAGTVVPTRALWEKLGVPVADMPVIVSRRPEWLAEISQELGAVTEAVAHGWVFGRGDETPVLKATTKLRRREADRGAVRILMTAGMPSEWGLGDDVPPGAVARRLQLYAETMGIGFGASPISTGLNLFEATAPKTTRQALCPVDWEPIPPARNRNLEVHFDWTRPPLEHERSREYVALFDRGSSYLATWSSLLLGMGAPEYRSGPVTFNPKQAGWWRITVPDNTIDGFREALPYPDLLDPDGTAAGRDRWVTTPALDYATRELGAQVDVHEAWIWPVERSKRVLDPLYKRIRGALAALHAAGVNGPDPDITAAEGLVKTTYKQLSGYFTSDQAAAAKSPLHQPYWFHAMIAQARVAILHQILATGQRNSLAGRDNVWPVVVSNNDLVGYLADTLNEAQAWPGEPNKRGRGPGEYKLTRYAPLANHLKFLTGRGWSGRDATTRFTETRDGPHTGEAQ